MDQRELRNCLGLFSTGVIIACAKKKNFLSETFFAEKFFREQNIIQKFEDSWHEFLEKNPFGQKIKDKLDLKKDNRNLSEKGFALKLKKLFADEFFGMTINSFTSVSLDPPLVLFSIDNKSSNLSLFKKNRNFTLNILSNDQQDLSNAFATPKNSSKWGVEPYFFSNFGNPIFKNSIAYIECEKFKVLKVGDHHIIIGRVLDFQKISDKEPLLYYGGKYVKLSK